MRTSAQRAFRPALEALEWREVPATFLWTGAVSTNALDAANWSSMEEPGGLPGEDDHLHFTGGPVANPGELGGPPSPPPSSPSVNCDNLQSLGTGFAGVHIEASYTGTVTMGEALTVGAFDLANGAISQSASAYDLTVTGTFNWTGGTLNSMPSAAVVYLNGGGAITLPGGNNTLTTGSTLSFGSSGGEKLTTISGGGNLLLNGTGDGIFVNADAKVNKVLQVGSDNAVKGVDNQLRTLTVATGAHWGYVGQGTATLELQVLNMGGTFLLQGQVNLAIKNFFNSANVFGYLQTVAAPTSTLEIQNGSVLDVSATKGADVSRGKVILVGNPAVAQQVATIKGKFEFRGGLIGFHQTPTEVGGTLVWGQFRVEGDALWAGGIYNPGLDCRQPGQNQFSANKWVVTGTLTIDTSNADKPTIIPVPQFLPEGQQVAGQWTIIEANKITSAPNLPQFPQGWQLLPATVNDGTVKAFDLKK
jgi:hypothetical protein